MTYEELQQAIKKINQKCIEEKNKVEIQYYQDYTGEKIFKIEHRHGEFDVLNNSSRPSHRRLGNTYTINDFEVSYAIDQYNNITGANFNKFPPVYVLKIVADKITRTTKNFSYENRSVQQFFNWIFNQHETEISAKELFDLLKVSLLFPVEKKSRKNHGFASWLFNLDYWHEQNYVPRSPFDSICWSGEGYANLDKIKRDFIDLIKKDLLLLSFWKTTDELKNSLKIKDDQRMHDIEIVRTYLNIVYDKVLEFDWGKTPEMI